MSRSILSLALYGAALWHLLAGAAHAANWRELSAEDIAAQSAVVEPGASVEVLLKTLDFDNSDVQYGSRQTFYVRLKVFDAKGVEQLQRIPIRYADEQVLSGFAARVVRSDGTVVAISRDAIFETEVTRSSRSKVRQKTFAPPGLSPGDIVEFQGTVASPGVHLGIFSYLHDNWPVRRAQINYKPIEYPGTTMRAISHQVEREEKGRDANGYYRYEVRNVPAKRDEPYSPPDSAIAPWLLVQQTVPGQKTGVNFWGDLGEQLWKDNAGHLRPRPAVAARAKALTAGAADEEEKLRRLYDFCRTEIASTAYDVDNRISPEQRKKIQGTDRPDETLARGHGNPHNIRVLFAALAVASGFEARLAQVNDRGQFPFAPELTNTRALPDGLVAIRLGEGWRYFDPGSRYHPFGELRWENEGVPVLLAGKGKPQFETTPPSRAERSLESRRGELSLDAAGTLQGRIVFEYRGHPGVELKEKLDGMSTAEREKLFEARIKELLPTAELSEIVWEDVTAPNQPLRVQAVVRAEAFADRAGDRLFVQPGVFARGRKPFFTAAERANDVYFPYPWSEHEEVILALPAGFELEAPSAPASIDRLPFAKCAVTLSVTKGAGGQLRLNYQRDFLCGIVKTPQRHYPAAKAIFDEIHRQDQHLLTLRKTGI